MSSMTLLFWSVAYWTCSIYYSVSGDSYRLLSKPLVHCDTTIVWLILVHCQEFWLRRQIVLIETALEILVTVETRLHHELDGHHPRIWPPPNTSSRVTDPSSIWVNGLAFCKSLGPCFISVMKTWLSKVSVGNVTAIWRMRQSSLHLGFHIALLQKWWAITSTAV